MKAVYVREMWKRVNNSWKETENREKLWLLSLKMTEKEKHMASKWEKRKHEEKLQKEEKGYISERSYSPPWLGGSTKKEGTPAESRRRLSVRNMRRSCNRSKSSLINLCIEDSLWRWRPERRRGTVEAELLPGRAWREVLFKCHWPLLGGWRLQSSGRRQADACWRYSGRLWWSEWEVTWPPGMPVFLESISCLWAGAEALPLTICLLIMTVAWRRSWEIFSSVKKNLCAEGLAHWNLREMASSYCNILKKQRENDSASVESYVSKKISINRNSYY